jgi:hypothetical protein
MPDLAERHLRRTSITGGRPTETAHASASRGPQGVLTGDNVEVRTRYQAGQWAHYEIAEVLEGGYRVFRRGSQEVLPDVFGPSDVRLDGDQ